MILRTKAVSSIRFVLVEVKYSYWYKNLNTCVSNSVLKLRPCSGF